MSSPSDRSGERPNRLEHETSPYLLQHSRNPVDWFPWGDEALAKAASEDKPIFLSIGYAACHWCHVMERESFENDAIAEILNTRFVSIKVDREERPDLDGIYMKAVQALTGHGGWPLSAFLTPDGRPFYGGTYFPPERRHGMPAFGDVLIAISDEYEKNRQKVVEQAQRLLSHLKDRAELQEAGDLSWSSLESATDQFKRDFDAVNGGFGGAPKFPPSMAIRLLLREHVRTASPELLDIATVTLDRMAAGGIYDQLGGGFHRYSTDEQWLAPHFEKMLYDNALLCAAYLEAFLVTGEENYRRIVRETLDYELREMRDAGGGFHSTEDADSEGEEGKFYVWTEAELMEILGADDGPIFCAYYDVGPSGNWEGKSILRTRRSAGEAAAELGVSEERVRAVVESARKRLLDARARRVRPGVDDKVLVSWNALLIGSLARAGSVLDEPRYTGAATEAARFIGETMTDGNGRLMRTYRAGKAKGTGFLEDYAFLSNALVDLYEASFDVAHLREALRLADVMIARFHDEAEGGFFFTPDDHERTIVRLKDPFDGATPSATSVAVQSLLRLARLCDRADLRAVAVRTLEAYAGIAARAPQAFPEFLIGMSAHLAPSREIALVGQRGDADTRALTRAVRERFLPGTVVAFADPAESGNPRELIRLLDGKGLVDGKATAYVCENYACRSPINSVADLQAALR